MFIVSICAPLIGIIKSNEVMKKKTLCFYVGDYSNDAHKLGNHDMHNYTRHPYEPRGQIPLGARGIVL